MGRSSEFKNPEGQIARWVEILSMYDMTIEHRPGTQHKNADAFSRRPCAKCKFDPGWETAIFKAVSESRTPRPANEGSLDAEKDISEVSLKQLQEEDKDISLIRKWVDNKQMPSPEEVHAGGTMIKSL